MATSAAADGGDGLRWVDWWPCFTLTKPSSPLRSPPHGWCQVIDGLGFDRVWSPRKLSSGRTLSSSSILRRDRQNGEKEQGVEECVFSTLLPIMPCQGCYGE